MGEIFVRVYNEQPLFPLEVGIVLVNDYRMRHLHAKSGKLFFYAV